MHGLVAFLIFALVILVVASIIIYIIDLIPGIPAPAPAIIKLIIGVICLIGQMKQAAKNRRLMEAESQKRILNLHEQFAKTQLAAMERSRK